MAGARKELAAAPVPASVFMARRATVRHLAAGNRVNISLRIILSVVVTVNTRI